MIKIEMRALPGYDVQTACQEAFAVAECLPEFERDNAILIFNDIRLRVSSYRDALDMAEDYIRFQSAAQVDA